jgi:hypothetical protein
MLLREERRALLLKTAENVLAFDEVIWCFAAVFTAVSVCMECLKRYKLPDVLHNRT